MDNKSLALPAAQWERLTSPYRNYEVSSSGEVRRGLRRLVGDVDRYGYRRVLLSYAGLSKRFKVHRLVCEAYHGPSPEGCEVGHLDGDRQNNSAVNLAWVTRSENVRHSIQHGTFAGRGSLAIATAASAEKRRGKPRIAGPGRKFTDDQVAEMRGLRSKGWSEVALAKHYRCSPSTAHKIVTGKSYAQRP